MQKTASGSYDELPESEDAGPNSIVVENPDINPNGTIEVSWSLSKTARRCTGDFIALCQSRSNEQVANYSAWKDYSATRYASSCSTEDWSRERDWSYLAMEPSGKTPTHNLRMRRLLEPLPFDSDVHRWHTSRKR